MTLWLLKTILRDNWHLAALLAGVLAVGAYLQHLNGRATSGEAEAASVKPASTAAAVPIDNHTPERESPQDRTRTIIAEHKARLEANPAAQDSPALLKAMGNLYRQKLGDYANAVQCYELLLHDYPESEAARTALIELATCYDRLGDHESVRRVYREMTRRFPSDSEEYLWAKLQLGE